MSSSTPQPPLEDIINNMRTDLLRKQSDSDLAGVNSFDYLVEQLKIFAKNINDKSTEIIRLQELCKKNNIDFAIPPPAPHPSTHKISEPPKEQPNETKN